MVATKEQIVATIAAAKEAVRNGAEIPIELRCQYPSKPCDQVRTTKRGGGLHRLCSFHRGRANKNQWLVDQRRRLRREREGTLQRKGSIDATAATDNTSFTNLLESDVLLSLDVLDASESSTPLDAKDIQILQALLFEDEDGSYSDVSDTSETSSSDTIMEWLV